MQLLLVGVPLLAAPSHKEHTCKAQDGTEMFEADKDTLQTALYMLFCVRGSVLSLSALQPRFPRRPKD